MLFYNAASAAFQGHCQSCNMISGAFTFSTFPPVTDIHINSEIWKILSNWDILKYKVCLLILG